MNKEELKNWDLLTDAQKQGILDAIKEVESGKGIPHKKVMEEMRKKFLTPRLK